MAASKKPETFTAISYVINKTGDGSVRCREEVIFERIPSPKGTYRYKPIKRTVYMPVEEQVECDKKMMIHVGEALSEYLSNHPDKTF